MKILVVGAGAQGAPAASILAKDEDISKVRLADINLNLVNRVIEKIGSEKIEPLLMDAENIEELASAAEGMDAIINLTQPRFNLNIMEAALRSGANYTDTAAGPNLELAPVDLMLNEQFALDEKFKYADLTALISTGGTPGVSDVLARYLCDKLDKVDEINIDPDRINQILLNLYLNAIEAMEPGGKLQVDISDSDENGSLNIQVSDTGKGIDKKDLPKIFDPYFTTKSSGTGLGLAIAHNIVEAMGGTIEVKSEVGKGTAFTLRLPIGD